MSSAAMKKKVNAITQIVRLRQVVRRWKTKSLMNLSDEPGRRTPPGSVAVYVGEERQRFVVPTRFLNFPVFVGLLKQAEEELGYQADGGIAVPCESGLFRCIIHLLHKDEKNLHGLGLHDFVQMAHFHSCKGSYSSPPPPPLFCAVTPLLHKTSYLGS